MTCDVCACFKGSEYRRAARGEAPNSWACICNEVVPAAGVRPAQKLEVNQYLLTKAVVVVAVVARENEMRDAAERPNNEREFIRGMYRSCCVS